MINDILFKKPDEAHMKEDTGVPISSIVEDDKQTANDWILVEDELPKKGGLYIVTLSNNDGTTETFICTYVPHYKKFYTEFGVCDDVIAWLPSLPKPYIKK